MIHDYSLDRYMGRLLMDRETALYLTVSGIIIKYKFDDVGYQLGENLWWEFDLKLRSWGPKSTFDNKGFSYVKVLAGEQLENHLLFSSDTTVKEWLQEHLERVGIE